MLRRDLLAALAAAIASLVPLEDLPIRTRDGPARPGDAATTAVVDRIDDGTAVVLFEGGDAATPADPGPVVERRTIPVTVLPANAREEGVVLAVPPGESLALARVDRAATRARREAAEDRLGDRAGRPD